MNYLKAYLNSRMLKKQYIIIAIIIIVVTAFYVNKMNKINHLEKQVKNYKTLYNKSKQNLKQSSINNKKNIKGLKKQNNELKGKINNQNSAILTKDGNIQKLNQEKEELTNQLTQFENKIKEFSAIGEVPINYVLPEKVSQSTYTTYRGKLVDVGEWLGTYYAPNEAECSNNKGITASGEPIVPGQTIAIDPRYWSFGDKFYIEGIGKVVAKDTGSAIKGRERFDFAVFSTKISNSGSFRAHVYQIVE